ncbi:MAG: hypothetical protein PHD11_08375 [Bacteroidales bacterium]|nr:hypothetical protein [Bacteroidales bacterium]MDD4476520.1 hypothetical protein [Eubacteriales bacterium]
MRSYKKSTDINLIYIALIVLLGIAVPEIIPRLNRWQEALGAFPDLISRLSGVVLGYILFIIPNIYLKISSAVVMALFVSFANIPANNIFYNKEVCGSYTGRVESDKTIPLELIDTCGIQLNIDSLDCTYIVLNCWQADWGVTKGYMPEFKQLCDKYKDDSTFKCLQRCV